MYGIWKESTSRLQIIRICHECEVWIDKSVPRVTVWHHEALPSDAKQWPEGQICWSIPLTNDRFFFLHTFLCKSLNKLQFYLKIRHTPYVRHFVLTSLYGALVTCVSDHVTWRPLQPILSTGSEHQGQNIRSDQYFWPWPKPWIYLYFIIRCARKSVLVILCWIILLQCNC